MSESKLSRADGDRVCKAIVHDSSCKRLPFATELDINLGRYTFIALIVGELIQRYRHTCCAWCNWIVGRILQNLHRGTSNIDCCYSDILASTRTCIIVGNKAVFLRAGGCEKLRKIDRETIVIQICRALLIDGLREHSDVCVAVHNLNALDAVFRFYSCCR